MRFPLAVLAVLCGLVVISGIGTSSFLDAREARDAQVAREVAASREVLTPLYGTEAWLEKPILAYGPDATIRVLSHAPERDSRTFRAIVAILLVLVTGSAGALHFGAPAGWFSALVLVTTAVLPLATRADGTQLLGTLLGWLGLTTLAGAVFDPHRGRATRLTLGYSALGLTLVTAGPLPALWPLGGLALYAALARRREIWARAQPLAGAVLMLGMAIPWYGFMIERYGGAFLAHVPFFPYAAEPRGAWIAGALAIVSFLVMGLFPWSTLLPGAMLHAATFWRRGGALPDLERERESREENAAHFFLAGLVASLAPIVFYPTPPLSAVLPAAPAAALLCGRMLAHAWEDVERVAAPIGRAVVMLALVGTLTAVLIALTARFARPAAPELRLLATIVFVTAWLPLLARLSGRRLLAALLFAAPVAIGAPIAHLRLLPALETFLSAAPVARAMESVAPPLAPLVLLESPPPSLRLYGEHPLVVAASLPSALRSERASDRHTYLAFRPAREHEVARAVAVPLEILLRTPVLILARVRV